MDEAIETLFYTLEQHPELDAGGRVAFLRARAHDGLERFKGRLECEQDFKPRADALQKIGWKTVTEAQGKSKLVMLLPERQKDLVLCDMARGLEMLEENGVLLCCLPNDWGAKRFEGMLKQAAGEVENVAKNRCRAFWTRNCGGWSQDMLNEWREAGKMRRVMDGRFWSRPGLFSWDRIDPGSSLLTRYLPKQVGGRVADLGGGWGFLSDFILRERPEVNTLDFYEADHRAIEAARRNLGLAPSRARVRYHWHDVTQGLGEGRYDWIVMNPPFHEGRQPDPNIGLRFIVAAAEALAREGELWLVANKHLPYENLMREAFAQTLTIAEAEGYKVMMGAEPTAVTHSHRQRKRHR